MAKNLVMWDWDGTIVDNHGAAQLALQDMADKYGLEKITGDDLQNVMGAYRGAVWTFHFGSKADEPYQYFIQRFEENNKKIRLELKEIKEENGLIMGIYAKR